jgi:broad specificity phosphatase PhoE
VLARHGETDYNRERRFQGWSPVALNELGRRQAAELAERAAQLSFASLWCSPLLRARETAAVVGGRLGLAPREDSRLAETETGDWTGRLFAEVEEEDPVRLRAFLGGDPDFAFPGGESFRDQADRVMRALADIARGPRPALVVCHGVVIRLALARTGTVIGDALAAPVANAALVPLPSPLLAL